MSAGHAEQLRLAILEQFDAPANEYNPLAHVEQLPTLTAPTALDDVPAANEMRRIVPQQIMVHNTDGLLNIPQSLMPKAGGKQKYLRMVVLTKEEKIQAKIALGE